MTRFDDGPAAGQVLMLKRSPKYLRVVRDKVGTWDALDQLGDSAESTESIWAYELAELRGHAFVDGPKCHGCYPLANYRLALNPPTEEVMRDLNLWELWCEARETGKPFLQ